MLNRITIMGRLVADPELRYTKENIPVATFSVACERNMRDRDNNIITDFIDCVAWRHNAEFVSNNFSKGKAIIVDGKLHQRKFTTKDGQNRNVHEIQVDEVHFGYQKANERSESYRREASSGEGNGEWSEDNSNELPF